MTDARGDLKAAHDSDPVRLEPRYRTFGAIVGAGLAFVVMAGLYAATAILALDSVLLVRTIFDPGGPVSAGGPPFVWGVAPVAGAIAGWLVAPRALAGDRWSGSAMGIVTYAVAVVIGPSAVFGPSVATLGGRDPSAIEQLAEFVVGSMMLALLGAVVLLPLLIVCIAGGALWAVLFRRLVEASGGLRVTLPSKPFHAQWFLVGFGVAAAGWLIIAVGILGVFTGGPGFAD
jgi:hypothetical protein